MPVLRQSLQHCVNNADIYRCNNRALKAEGEENQIAPEINVATKGPVHGRFVSIDLSGTIGTLCCEQCIK